MGKFFENDWKFFGNDFDSTRPTSRLIGSFRPMILFTAFCLLFISVEKNYRNEPKVRDQDPFFRGYGRIRERAFPIFLNYLELKKIENKDSN